jgi:peptide chain release factor 2
LNWVTIFDIPNLEAKIRDLENEMADPNFWNNPEVAQQASKKLKILRKQVNGFTSLKMRYDDLSTLLALAQEEEDESIAQELYREGDRLSAELERMELAMLLNGPYDDHNVILTIHSGAGGTESQDWAQMLLRMYTRWAEDNGYEVETLDLLTGDEAGIKGVTLMISGPYAYGYLRSEKGVHRLVRISPFDAAGRRHTSFASVSVLPEVEQDAEIDLDLNEVRIDTYRASGAGGQHVNKTDSAVRLTHIPTGIVVQCQNERSQHKNRESAMKILKARLLERKMEEQEAKLNAISGHKSDIAWGNQIRSYVFCPYTMVKDHRTDVEMGDVEKVMDGYLEPFIQAYLRRK